MAGEVAGSGPRSVTEVATVQQALGHSQPQVTQRYAHLSTRTLQEAANSASAYITGAGHTDDAADYS